MNRINTEALFSQLSEMIKDSQVDLINQYTETILKHLDICKNQFNESTQTSDQIIELVKKHIIKLNQTMIDEMNKKIEEYYLYLPLDLNQEKN